MRVIGGSPSRQRRRGPPRSGPTTGFSTTCSGRFWNAKAGTARSASSLPSGGDPRRRSKPSRGFSAERRRRRAPMPRGMDSCSSRAPGCGRACVSPPRTSSILRRRCSSSRGSPSLATWTGASSPKHSTSGSRSRRACRSCRRSRRRDRSSPSHAGRIAECGEKGGVERGGDLERPVMSGAVEDDEARLAHLRGGFARGGEREEGLSFAPDERRAQRQVGEARRETVGFGESRDRGGRGAAPVVPAEGVEDEAKGRRGFSEEEKVEDPAGARAVPRKNARAFGFRVLWKREARRVHEDEAADLPGKLQRVPARRPAAEGVADEVELLERESARQRVRRGHAAPKAEAGGIARRLAVAGARRVRNDHRPAVPREEARGAAPVGRVGSEAVEEDDGPLRRERSEDERRKGGSVVRGKDLPPRARKEKAFLLNRPVDGEWIDGERAEEKGDEEGERGENPGQERNPPAHRPGANTRRATAAPRGCPRSAEAWRSPAAERNRRMRPSRRRASRARRATGRARPQRARRSRPRSRASASPRARRGGGSSASRFRRSPRSRTARASAGR